MAKPIQIAYLIDTIASDTEGTQKQLLETIRRIDSTRFSAHLVFLKSSRWIEEHPLPCPHTILGYEGFLKRSFPGVVRRLVDLLSEKRFDILQTVFEDATIVGFLGGHLCRPRPLLVSSRRDIGLGRQNQPWYHVLFRIGRPAMNLGFDGFVANSKQIRRMLIRKEWVTSRRIRVIQNGVELPGERYKRPQVFEAKPAATWIGIVASLTPVKRHDLFLDALGMIRETLVRENVGVLVLGEGPERASLERQVESLGLSSQVHFEGVVTNVSSYLQELDIGVLCSDREGLSNAILEYMANGIPVIASDAGGNPELVDETNGICFPRGEPAALAEALKDVILDKERRAAMGRVSRMRVKQDHTWARATGTLERYYDEIARARRRPGLAAVRRRLVQPAYFQRAGSPRISCWKELEKTQFLPRRHLEQIQQDRFRDLMAFVWENNPFYRRKFLDSGLKEGDLPSVADIRRLPVITKEEIRSNSAQMMSEGYSREELLEFRTGGSTGKALNLWITEELSERRNACAIRHDRWTGWEPGEPIAAAWGNPKLPNTWKDRLRNGLVQPYLYLDTMEVTDSSVLEFAESWERLRPTMLFGHAHSLYILAQYLRNLSIDTLRPNGVLSSSMMLLPHERSVIEDTFHCCVTDRYGCEEVSLIASECEKHEGMHMNIEHLVIEFLREDGTEAKAGEVGEVVVTDLMNKSMPFIRYRVEDFATPLGVDCSCGRGLPLMGNVAGRVADFLIKKDGTRVAGVSLIENTLTKIDGIDQMQIVQESYDEIALNVVAGSQFKLAQRTALLDYFQTTFGGSVRIDLKIVDNIGPEQSGKYRFSICRVGARSRDRRGIDRGQV